MTNTVWMLSSPDGSELYGLFNDKPSVVYLTNYICCTHRHLNKEDAEHYAEMLLRGTCAVYALTEQMVERVTSC